MPTRAILVYPRGPVVLTVETGSDPEWHRAVVDISHDALIRTWGKITDASTDPTTGVPNGCLEREADDGRRWRSLVEAADAFAKNPKSVRNPDQLLSDEAWGTPQATRGVVPLRRKFEEAKELLTASRTARDEGERRERNR